MRLRSKWLSLLLLVAASTTYGQPQLHDLDIRVVLSKNGDARITETRKMTIDGQGTECYIGLGNMGPSTVTDLAVSDETGRKFENVGAWDINRSRDWKKGRCGIVEKDNGGYELCWGLGDSGERTYITAYTITGLVRGFTDADALRHVFLDASVSPKPEHAKVTLVGEDTTLVFMPDTCGIWGFRFKGELWYENGTLFAETTEAMSAEAAIYIMAMFPKGMFMPTNMEDDTFEHKKQLAFEGSDYGDTIDDNAQGNEELSFKQILQGLLGIAMIAYCLLGGPKRHLTKLKNWIKRKRHESWVKSIDYCKTIPLGGNLQQANDMLNAYEYTANPDYQRLLSATVLQLVHQGAFSVKPIMTEKGVLDKRFVINKMPDAVLDSPLAHKMYQIFEEASGDDHVLDPTELSTFIKGDANKKLVRSFVDILRTRRDASYYNKQKDDVRDVYGFKKFLDDFTLMNERHMVEVKLWRDYMVWATLYGNAQQVMKDMKAINPEFFEMDALASQMVDDSVLHAINLSVYSSTDYMIRKIEREAMRSYVSSHSSSSYRSRGGGGHSSWGGGGGGFSGGGGGGGVR